MTVKPNLRINSNFGSPGDAIADKSSNRLRLNSCVVVIITSSIIMSPVGIFESVDPLPYYFGAQVYADFHKS